MIFDMDNVASVMVTATTAQFCHLLQRLHLHCDQITHYPVYCIVPHPDPANSDQLLRLTYSLHSLAQCKEVLGSPSLPLYPTRTFCLSGSAFIANSTSTPHSPHVGWRLH